ncbi:DUF454 family protein [Streptococcus merionis]|uniref:DUF454 family protein n=1 Tax=Streptococcus merionis TaxID=400065 RepID=UPI0038CDB629
MFLIISLLVFVLGTLGLYLPILPTTVFYLIAAFCFARSPDRLYQKWHPLRNIKNILSNLLSSEK